MINEVKDGNGQVLKEAEGEYIIERIDGSMTEFDALQEGVAALIGRTYLDCEVSETSWHMRVNSAKKIGLAILSTEDDASTIVYDERIGKIPYSYTVPNPDYDIPENPELIRIENDKTFLYTLAKIDYIRLWKRIEGNYENVLVSVDVDREIEDELVRFREHIQNIPLHKKLGE